MSYKTLEVVLENGRILPRDEETLPVRARALLTLLDSSAPHPAGTCGELAKRWTDLEPLPEEEAIAFANDLEHARTHLPPLKPAWD